MNAHGSMEDMDKCWNVEGLMRFWLEDVAVDLNEIVQGTPPMETFAVS